MMIDQESFEKFQDDLMDAIEGGFDETPEGDVYDSGVAFDRVMDILERYGMIIYEDETKLN
jgi:hypothetical protein